MTFYGHQTLKVKVSRMIPVLKHMVIAVADRETDRDT